MSVGSGNTWSGAIVHLVSGAILVSVSGFVGGALLFGDPPVKPFWAGAMIAGLVAGAIFLRSGGRRAQRALREGRSPPKKA